MGDTLLADRNVQDERRRALRLLARRAPTHGRWTSGQSTRRVVAVELEARGGCQELRACAIYPRLRSRGKRLGAAHLREDGSASHIGVLRTMVLISPDF